MTIRLEMVPVWTAAGYRFDVFHGDRQIVHRSRVPACDAARALDVMGLRGKFEVWRKGSSHPALIGSVADASLLTVDEGNKTSPHFVRWRPFRGIEK